ncbi:hypothetical protein BD779DRAFT_1520893 [Infundibulicybe gibba]|nr:hypothetical protein BD779DRAFT_1520893 [Infundibulicybe gibba]
MPAAKFNDSYLPQAPIPCGMLSGATLGAFEAVGQTDGEVSMYPLWITAVDPFCPDLETIDAHSHPAPDYDGKQIKPDICVYARGSGRGSATLNDIKRVEIIEEFKYYDSDDPFDDTVGQPFERVTSSARDTLGQITQYATAHLAAQFRTHVFSLLVFRKYARLLRWDRSGVVVTEKINMTSRNGTTSKLHSLCDFLWRFNHATPEARGVDTSVTLNPELTDEQRTSIRQILGFGSEKPLTQLHAGSSDYIVGDAVYMGVGSPVGRSTRTFEAYSLKTKERVFLKDTWRVVSKTQRREDEIYVRLKAAGVEHIAEFIEAGDLEGHITRSQLIRPTDGNEEWLKPPRRSLRTLQHYRLVLEDIERTLTEFTTTREMVTAFRDASEAHAQAYSRARILHRDISVGNILIKGGPGRGRGVLIDWDLCKDLDHQSLGATQSERTGTWQFIAARLLMPTDDGSIPIPNLTDDVESFFHVLTYVAVLYTAHQLDASRLSRFISSNFEDSYKILLVLVEIAHFKNPPLVKLIQLMTEVLTVRYVAAPREEHRLAHAALQKLVKDHANLKMAYDQNIVTVYMERLAALDDGFWLPRILSEALKWSGWEIEGGRVEHEKTSMSDIDARDRS